LAPAETAHVATTRQGSGPPGRAYRSPVAIAIFVGSLVLGLAGDLLSKHFVFRALLSDSSAQEAAWSRHVAAEAKGARLESRDVLDLFKTQTVLGVRFKLQTNKGVVFGTELHSSQTVHRLIVAGVSLLLLGMVLVFFATSHARAWAVHLALGTVLAGAMGNLYDRLFSVVEVPPLAPARYQVRDFIDCSALGYPWVYNVADALLVVGVGLLLLQWFVTGRQQAAARKAGEKAA